jgi:hypothetical protein
MAEPADSDDPEAATSVGAGDDPTTAVPPVTEPAPDLAWSQHDDDGATEPMERRSWHSALGVAAALVAGGALLAIAVSFGFWASGQTSTELARQQVAAPSSSTIAAPTTQTGPQQTVTQAAPPPKAPPAAVAPTTMATTKPPLPVSIEGSSCRLESTPTVDPDGVPVYCALFPEMPLTAMWSRTRGPLAWPTIGGVRVPDQEGSYPWVVVCEQQTGRTYNYCEKAIAQATYQGDGLMPVG